MLTESIWPQPHENVQGINRTRDDLLSLDDAALQRRAVMMTLASALWKAALLAAHTEAGRPAYVRMTDPRPGDLVVEIMSMRHPHLDTDDKKSRTAEGFGIFLEERREWTCSHEEWKTEVEEARRGGIEYTLNDRVTTMAMYIQYGPSAQDVCRWVNCSVVALPTGMLYHTQEMQP